MHCELFPEHFFYHGGEMGHLQLVLLLCDIICGIVGSEGYSELAYDLATITNVGDIMNSHASLCLTRCLDSLVHVMSPHALTAILR